ncbi:MAG: hypothetical protein ACRDJ5_08995, partial [Actinomycetota bacterium]
VGLKRLGLAVDDAANATQDEYALAPDPDDDAAQDEYDAETRVLAKLALAALLDQDDDLAADHLADLTPDQLQRVENAAVALSLHASRLRPDEPRPLEGEPEDHAALRGMLADIITFLEGRDAKTISAAVWARIRPVLHEHAAQTHEQQQRADQAETEGRNLLKALDAERANYATWQQRVETAEARLRARIRALANEQPDVFRQHLRDEIRRDPEWWRNILRHELRLGHLREDFHRDVAAVLGVAPRYPA